MDALSYVEHYDGFNFENIPGTKFDTAYHIEMGVARGLSNNQNCQVTEVPYTVRAFFAGGADPKAVLETSIASGDAIVAEMIDPSNRLVQSGLKNVRFDSMSVEPVADSNDNSIVVKVDFTAMVITDTSS